MTTDKKDNLFYVKIFLAIFALILLFAVIVRTYHSFINRQFTQNTFNILIASDEYVGVIGVEDSTKSLYSAVITENLDSSAKRNLFVQSINFKIPIHAYLVYPDDVEAKLPTKNFFTLSNIQSIVSNSKIDKKNITMFDWLRLFNLARSIPEDRVFVKNYASMSDLVGLISSESDEFFGDSTIAGKKTSLQIINGTSVNGLGSRLGEMFARTGFNVVSVVTSRQEESSVYYNEDSVLNEAKIIAKSLDLQLIKSDKHAIASITLVVGEDSELMLEDLSY